jgi:hypothetical protein
MPSPLIVRAVLWAESSSESDGHYSSVASSDIDESDAVYLSEEEIDLFVSRSRLCFSNSILNLQIYAPSTSASAPDGYVDSEDDALVEEGEDEDENRYSSEAYYSLIEDESVSSDGGGGLEDDGISFNDEVIGSDEGASSSNDGGSGSEDETIDSNDEGDRSDDDGNSFTFSDPVPFEPISGDVQWMTENEQIFDPITLTFIPMPDTFEDIKQAFVNAFKHFTKILILTENHINMDDIYRRWVPEELWTTLFNEAETIVLTWSQERVLFAEMEKSYDIVLSDWIERDLYPDIPCTREQLEVALAEDERSKRMAQFCALLKPRNDQVDGWLLSFFDPYKDVVDLDLLRTHTLQGAERSTMCNILAAYADAQYVLVVLHQCALHIAFREAAIVMDELLIHLDEIEIESTHLDHVEIEYPECPGEGFF